MTHQEKTEKWNSRSAMDMFRNKSKLDTIPLWIGWGSSSHHPERKGGVTTCDMKMWCKFADNDWFVPYGDFDQDQIEDMVLNICKNDQQVECLMAMLASKAE